MMATPGDSILYIPRPSGPGTNAKIGVDSQDDTPTWVRSSNGRATLLQGEGSGFESPRIHFYWMPADNPFIGKPVMVQWGETWLSSESKST